MFNNPRNRLILSTSIWTVLLIIALVAINHRIHEQAVKIATAQAHAIREQSDRLRTWNLAYSGVFVEMLPSTPEGLVLPPRWCNN